MASNLVFVYGTLKSGQPNHYFLTDPKNGKSGQILGQFQTVEKFSMVTATKFNIPFLLSNTGSKNSQNDVQTESRQILGQVYSVDEKMLKNLDILENYPKFYNRRVISVTNTETGAILKALCYVLENFNSNLLNLPLIDNFDAEQVGYVPPQNRPTGWLNEQFLENIQGPRL